jgi:hypothetical protein
MPLLILAEIAWATEGPERANETALRAGELGSRRGLGEILIASRTTRLGPLFEVGRWDELLDLARAVIEWSAGAGAEYEIATARPWEALVLQHRGRLDEASAAADDFMPLARHVADPQILVPAAVAAGSIALAQQRIDVATGLIEEIEGAAEVSAWYREHYLADLVRLCIGTGNLAAAERIIGQVDAFATRHRISLVTADALMHEAKGEFQIACAGHLEAAPEWESYGNVLEHARALLGAGRCLRGVGLPADQHLARAKEVFENLGAVSLLREAESLLLNPA